MTEPEQAVAVVGGAPSGRVGDRVFTRGTHGPYSYLWSPRLDPNTPWQQPIRVWFGTAAEVWKNFSPTLRQTWRTYAENTPTNGRAARPCSITGHNCFVGTYVFTTQVYIPISDTAPNVFTFGKLGPPTYAPHPIPLFCIVTFSPNDPWRHNPRGAIAIYTSRPQTAAVNYFSGPFRHAGTVYGNPATPPTQALIRYAFFPTPTKRRIYIRARVIEPDSRLSPPNVQYLDVP